MGLFTPFRLLYRSQQIAWFFSQYGLGGFLASIGIEMGRFGFRLVRGGNAKMPAIDTVFGKNLATTFIKLGPTFIKLGQILASRSELVGEPVADELKILFDRVPSVPFRKIQHILRRELGPKKLKDAFKHIDPKAVASASISQIHRATLRDGKNVLVKVQKPGSARLVTTDLEILQQIAWPLHFLYPKWNLWQLFEEFKSATLREIDYREEAKNIEQFQKNHWSLFRNQSVVFPRFFKDLTTSQVLVMEPLKGTKLSDLKKGSTVARRAATMSLASIMEQIFGHGFFHADPHAGNLFFMEEEGRIGFVDLGLVGRLEGRDKKKFLRVLLALLRQDKEELVRSIWDLGTAGRKTNSDKFKDAIHQFVGGLKGKNKAELRFDELIEKLLHIANTHDFSIPNRYLMMLRSCLIIEGVARHLDPNISVVSIAAPIVAKSLIRQYSPFRMIEKLLRL